MNCASARAMPDLPVPEVCGVSLRATHEIFYAGAYPHGLMPSATQRHERRGWDQELESFIRFFSSSPINVTFSSLPGLLSENSVSTAM